MNNNFKKSVNSFLGLLMIVIGIILGIYIGVWIMFAGGILDIVEFIKNDWQNMQLLAWGIVKILLAKVVGGLSAYIFVAPGFRMLFY